MLEIMMTPSPKVSPKFRYKQTLMSSTPRASLRYGAGVAISPDGRTIAVSEPGGGLAANNSGALYIYGKSGDTYSLLQKIGANGNPASIYMGESMAASADMRRIILGAIGDSGRVASAGSAYIMESVNGVYSQKAKLTASNGNADDKFGESVSMTSSGTRVAIGASYRDDRGGNSGAVYIFDEVSGTFTQKQMLLPDAATNNGWFGIGCQLSSNGEYLAVQAYTNNGTVYVYRDTGSGFSIVKRLVNPGGGNQSFGISMFFSPDNTKLFIGSPGGGKQVVYEYSVTPIDVLLEKTITQNNAEQSSFGRSFALSTESETLLVGASSLNNGNGGFYTMSFADNVVKEESIYRANTGLTTAGIGMATAISAKGDVAVSGGKYYATTLSQLGCVEIMVRDI